MEYVLSSYGWAYSPPSDEIKISSDDENYDVLTDSELITVIGDSIMHEFIHSLLCKEFNTTVSKLFDTVGHLLYSDYDLNDKMYRKDYEGKGMEWKDFIKECGIHAFYIRYKITENDLYTARNICRRQ